MVHSFFFFNWSYSTEFVVFSSYLSNYLEGCVLLLVCIMTGNNKDNNGMFSELL